VKRTASEKSAVFTIYRPELVELNDSIPLTFEISGVPRDTVNNTMVDNGSCLEVKSIPAATNPKSYIVDLHHSQEQFLPEKIGILLNNEGRTSSAEIKEDPDFPGIQALLLRSDDRLKFTLDNNSGKNISKMVLTYRLPNGWSPPITSQEYLKS